MLNLFCFSSIGRKLFWVPGGVRIRINPIFIKYYLHKIEREDELVNVREHLVVEEPHVSLSSW